MVKRPACTRLALWLCLLSSACATARPPLRLAPPVDPEGIEAVGTSLPLYQLKSAKWVPQRALLVNADFRFDAAMVSLEGPALEYSRRTQVNQQRATELATMPPIDWAGALREAAERPELGEAYSALTDTHTEVAAFGLLFGDPRARVQAVLDVMQGQMVRQRYVLVSEARDLQGDASWLQDHGAPVARFLRASALPLLTLAATHATPLPTGGREVTCAVGGSQQARGRVLTEAEGYVDLAVFDKPPAVMRCPREALGEPAPASMPEAPTGP